MSELFSNLGINWKILAAQIVNFAVLLVLLRAFAYKPILKILDERRQKIAKDKENSEKIEKGLQDISLEKEKVLAVARTDSEKIINEAEKNASEIKETAKKDAKSESEKIRISAEKEILESKGKIKEEVKKEIGNTLADAIEKSVGDVLDEKAKKQVFEKSLKVILEKK